MNFNRVAVSLFTRLLLSSCYPAMTESVPACSSFLTRISSCKARFSCLTVSASSSAACYLFNLSFLIFHVFAILSVCLKD